MEELNSQAICKQKACNTLATSATINLSTRIPSSDFIIYSSGHVSYIQAQFTFGWLFYYQSGTVGAWTSPRNACFVSMIGIGTPNNRY
jgi:hypothetical protein